MGTRGRGWRWGVCVCSNSPLRVNLWGSYHSDRQNKERLKHLSSCQETNQTILADDDFKVSHASSFSLPIKRNICWWLLEYDIGRVGGEMDKMMIVKINIHISTITSILAVVKKTWFWVSGSIDRTQGIPVSDENMNMADESSDKGRWIENRLAKCQSHHVTTSSFPSCSSSSSSSVESEDILGIIRDANN